MHLKRMGCAVLAAAAVTAMAPSAGALSGVSGWAQGEVVKAEASGLVPGTFGTLAASGSITRAEFCAVSLRLFQSSTGCAVELTEDQPFTDTHDPQVAAANALGLVSGRGGGIFDPDASVTRQELCVMLGNVQRAATGAGGSAADELLEQYSDADEVAAWAEDDMAVMVDYGVISGVLQPDGRVALAPGATATREQSLLMAVRFLESCGAGDLYADGSVDPEGSAPSVPDPTPAAPADDPEAQPGETVGPEEPDHMDEPEDGAGQTPVQPIQPDAAYDLTEEEKEALVFGGREPGYDTPEEAEAAMAEITVPVWRLQADGSKTEGRMTLTVNAALADLYTAVFEEIFAGEEKFPIKDGGSYSWRSNTRSEHRWGTAVDLNWDENMECNIDSDGNVTQITTGSCWEPGENPYSIPADGDVVRAFKKYGFAWGGDAWSKKRDYMHFSYFGR